MAAPFSTTLVNAALQFDYKAQVKPRAKGFGIFDYSLDVTKSSIDVERITTDTVITQVFGGVTVNVHVKGQCDGVQLTSTSAFKIDGGFHIGTDNGQLASHMDDFNLSNFGEWVIQVRSCTGPAGYEQILKGEISKLLKDPASLKKLLAQHLQNKFNALTDSLNQSLFETKSLKLSEELRVSVIPEKLTFDPSNGQILLGGVLMTETGSAEIKKNDIHIPVEMNSEDLKHFTSSGLLIPHEYTDALNKILYQEKFLEKRLLGKDISGFVKLLSNRFYQFFIWPDLMNFKTNAPFQFDVSAQRQPQVVHAGYSEGALWFNIKAQIVGKMWAPIQNKLYPYINFNTPLHTYAWLMVEDGDLIIGAHEPKMQLHPTWNPSYISTYNPSTYIGLSTIQSEITRAAADTRLTYPLPQLKIDNKKLLVPQKFFSTKKWIQLIFATPN